MTIQTLSWALQCRTGSPTDKVLLLCLANHANKEWSCFPGQDTIAQEAELKERATRDGLKRLEDGGFITRIRRNRSNRSRTSDLYILDPTGNGANALKNLPAECAGRDGPTGISHRTYRQEMPGNEPKGEYKTPLPPSSKQQRTEAVADASTALDESEPETLSVQNVLSFEKFETEWPWNPSESRTKARRAFRKLDHSDRWAAWSGVRLFKDWMRSPEGKRVSASNYMRGQLWKNKPDGTDDKPQARPKTVFVQKGAANWDRCAARFSQTHDGRSPPIDQRKGKYGWHFPTDWPETATDPP